MSVRCAAQMRAVHAYSARTNARAHTSMHGPGHARTHARMHTCKTVRTHVQVCDVFHMHEDVCAQEWSSGSAESRART